MRTTYLSPILAALFCFLFMLFTAPATLAQQSNALSFGPQSEDRDKQTDEEPDEQELDEMQAVYNRCTQRFHSQYLDCRCVAVKFLDLRMEIGPGAPQSLILDKVYGKCPATAAVAGKTYNRCLNWASMMRRDYKRFCECYANHYAATFSDDPSLRPLAQQNMMSRAMSECGYNEPLNERARQERPIGSREGPSSEIDTLFGQNGE